MSLYRYGVRVEGVVPARVVHRKALAALGPGFAIDGFDRLKGASIAAWQRSARQEFVVAWVQPSRSPDAFGWFGTKFTIEFRRGARPSVGVSGPGLRFCRLLDDEGREQVRDIQNAVIRRMPPAPAHVFHQLEADSLSWYLDQGREVATAYSAREDTWFRYGDEHDLDAWFRLLPILLPGVLQAVRQRFG